MSLRQLTNDQLFIKQMVEREELTAEDVKDHMELLDLERKDKIESILYVINDLQSTANAQKAEAERVTAMQKKTESSIEQLKSYLLFNMEDGEKHDFDLFRVSRVKGRQVVNILDESKLPKSHLTHKPETWSPDKRLILADLKKGVEIEGAEIETGNPSLRIK